MRVKRLDQQSIADSYTRKVGITDGGRPRMSSITIFRLNTSSSQSSSMPHPLHYSIYRADLRGKGHSRSLIYQAPHDAVSLSVQMADGGSDRSLSTVGTSIYCTGSTYLVSVSSLQSPYGEQHRTSICSISCPQIRAICDHRENSETGRFGRRAMLPKASTISILQVCDFVWSQNNL